jgi:hypothetical protein
MLCVFVPLSPYIIKLKIGISSPYLVFVSLGVLPTNHCFILFSRVDSIALEILYLLSIKPGKNYLNHLNLAIISKEIYLSEIKSQRELSLDWKG